MFKSAPLLKFIHFADDTTLFATHDNLDTLIHLLNDQLKSVDKWLCINRLSLNTNKTNYMITTNKEINSQVPIKIRDAILGRVEYAKFLGVWIDENLSFKKHTKHVTTKVSHKLPVQCEELSVLLLSQFLG